MCVNDSDCNTSDHSFFLKFIYRWCWCFKKQMVKNGLQVSLLSYNKHKSKLTDLLHLSQHSNNGLSNFDTLLVFD